MGKCLIGLTCCRTSTESTWAVSWNQHMPQLNQHPYLHGWTFKQTLLASWVFVWQLSSWWVYSLMQVDHGFHPSYLTCPPFLCISEGTLTTLSSSFLLQVWGSVRAHHTPWTLCLLYLQISLSCELVLEDEHCLSFSLRVWVSLWSPSVF